MIHGVTRMFSANQTVPSRRNCGAAKPLAIACSGRAAMRPDRAAAVARVDATSPAGAPARSASHRFEHHERRHRADGSCRRNEGREAAGAGAARRVSPIAAPTPIADRESGAQGTESETASRTLPTHAVATSDSGWGASAPDRRAPARSARGRSRRSRWSACAAGALPTRSRPAPLQRTVERLSREQDPLVEPPPTTRGGVRWRTRSATAGHAQCVRRDGRPRTCRRFSGGPDRDRQRRP
jgi:hypothetical protein